MVSLSKKDKVFVETLRELGVNTPYAHTIVYLGKVEEALQYQIQEATGLAQPQVSSAIGQLRARGWIQERKTKKKQGKGRPRTSYSLTVPLNEVLEDVRIENEKKIEEIQKGLERLRELMG